VQEQQIRPETSGFGAQSLTLGERGGSEAAQRHEADDAVGARVFVGHAASPRNTAYSLEQMSVNGQGAIHPLTEAGVFSPHSRNQLQRSAANPLLLSERQGRLVASGFFVAYA
jgi:hypothetical protein